MNLLPIGIKGLAVAGLFAVIMSTADSWLNVGGILFTRNLIAPFMERSNRPFNEVAICRLATFFIGAIGMLMAYYSQNIIKMKFYALGFYTPIVIIPFVGALIGMRGNYKTFFYPSFVSVMVFSLSIILLPKSYKSLSLLLSLVSNFCAYLIFHIREFGKITWIPEKEINMSAEKHIPIFKKALFYFHKIIPTPSNLLKYSSRKVRRYGSSHIVFGGFFCLSYIVPVFMWTQGETPNSIYLVVLRFIGGILSTGLILEKRWPYSLRKYFPLYWHLSLLYCLPLLSTSIYLLMNGSTEWLINICMSILLLAWLVDWKTYLIIYFIGTFIGGIIGYMMVPDFKFISTASHYSDFSSLFLFIYTIIFSSILGIVFFRKKEGDIKRKLSTLKILGGSMAHEVKNVIGLDTTSHMLLEMIYHSIKIKSKEPKNINGREKSLLTLELDEENYNKMGDLIKNQGYGSKKGLLIIKRILTNMTREIKGDDFEVTNIKDCIKSTLEKYGFTSEQRNRISIEVKDNFSFIGSEYYVRHVLYNLIRNAYKFCREDCIIKIWTENNRLYFEDNGPGISNEHLPYIFQYFYSSTDATSGIGLSFSKLVMEKIGGDIKVITNTEKPSYTRFILEFPRMNK